MWLSGLEHVYWLSLATSPPNTPPLSYAPEHNWDMPMVGRDPWELKMMCPLFITSSNSWKMALMSPLSFLTCVKHSTVFPIFLFYKRHWSEPTHFAVDCFVFMQQTTIRCGGWCFIWYYFCAIRCSTGFSSGTFIVSYLYQPCFLPDTYWWIQTDNVCRQHLPLQTNPSTWGL